MEKYDNTIDLRRFWREVKKLRWVYLAAILAFGIAATVYVCRMLPKVPIVGQMLIGEESIDTSVDGQLASRGAGGVSQMLKTFSVGGFGAAAVDNEVLVLGSHQVLKNTVKALNLNRSYVGKTAQGKKKMLFRDMPVTVEAPAEYFDTLSVAYTVKINLLDGGKADVRITKGLLRRTVAEASAVTLPAVIKSPLGNIQILRTDCFESSPYRQITVSVAGNDRAAIILDSQVEIDVATKLSDVIRIDLDYPDAELGKAIVNGIMAEYNSTRLGRLHQTAENTIRYYDERLAETLGNLEKAEQRVADYRQGNSIVAPEAEAAGLLSLTQEQKLSAMEASNQLDYYNKVISTLRGNLTGDALIPQIESLGDTNIVAYNKLVMQRRDLERSATPENPKVVLLNEKITTLRNLIIDNSEKSAAKARKDINFQFSVAGTANSRLNRYPGMEMELTSLSRDRQFQSSLYQFLVQSRENAVLKMYADTDVGYIFQPAYEAKAGLPLKKILIVVVAIVFAMICVTVLALILLWCHRNVSAPMDLAFLGIEDRAIGGGQSVDSILRMRSMILNRPEIHTLYVADFTNGSDNILTALTESFTKAGMEVETLSVSDNSELLSPESIRQPDASSAYLFVRVPDAVNLFEIESLVDSPQAALLLIVPPTMRRNQLKRYLKGQTAAKIFTIIL